MSHFFLVHLRAVNGQPRSSVQLLVADVTLEVLCLLVIDEHLLVIKLSLTVPADKWSSGRVIPHQQQSCVPDVEMYSTQKGTVG